MHVALLVAPIAALQVPAGQGSNVMLALAAPTVAQKPPGLQESQTVAPGRPLNVPAAQGVQVEAPYPELKLPTPHCVHELLPF